MNTNRENRYHHGNLKEELIKTALEILNTGGIQSITLRKIGDRLGTSRSAIYRHFKNKEALMKQVILSGLDELDRLIEPVFSNENFSLLERFHAMGLCYISFAISNPHLYRLIFGQTMLKEREEVIVDKRANLHKLLHGDSSDELMQAEQSNGFHKLVSIIIQAQEEKVFKEGDPVLIATAIWALLHGLASLAIDGHLSVKDNMEAIYETNYKMLLEGLVKK